METSEPLQPLAARPPEDCTCGSSVMCPLHFDADDYRPGLQVRFNPYTVYKYGLPGKTFTGYEVFTVLESRMDDCGILTVTVGNSQFDHFHVGWFYPTEFLYAAKQAIREHNGENNGL